MTYKNDKLRDLTPLVTSFLPGESPTAQKLQGMMRQADAAIAYLEDKVGDLAGEEGVFNTWISTIARGVGDYSKLNPLVLPNFEILEYEQPLALGVVEHELDMIPVGELDDLIAATLDSSIVISQWKAAVNELEKPGDWTIAFSYIENGQIKRGRKLVTHAPAEGGSVIFKKVTSGRGSSLERSSENTIPNLAQAEDGGPFAEIEVIDSFAKTYQVTLPVRTKMYDKLGSIINFSASNTTSNVGLNSQYELPQFFFGLDGLDLESDDLDSLPKFIPLNLIKLYDWDLKKEVEGVIALQAAPNPVTRKYQFTLQTKQDVILNIATGKYIVVVAGNPIINQIKGLLDTVYGNTGIGNDMTRLISHKNLLDLRTGSVNITNRSKYYGPSSINNNDHSMYFHRDGYTATDLGAGGNVIRGDIVVGNTETGASDLVHENFNIDADSYGLRFANIANGPLLKYAKAKTYSIDHSYGGLPTNLTDAGLWIEGAVSDVNPARKNIFLEGDVRTSGNIILGKAASDVIFIQGKAYVNDELTFIPRLTTGLTAEEGKNIYSSAEKAMVFYNGSKWVSPWNFSGYTTTMGDGITSFGKFNGTTYATFVSAIADLGSGGTLKILPGAYNILTNKVSIPANMTIEGSGELTVISGTGTIFENTGANVTIRDLLVQNAAIGIKDSSDNLTIRDIKFNNCAIGLQAVVTGTNLKVLDNVNFTNCVKTIDYANTSFITSQQTIMKSALTYSNTNVNDWGLKEEVLKEYSVSSGVAVVTYDSTLDGAIGKGAFRVIGNGNIVCKKMLPVNGNVGIGGHINIRKLGATGSVSIGVNCFDASYNNLGVRYFILNNEALTTNAMDAAFYKGLMIGFTGFAGLMFPASTRFVQPTMAIISNDGGVIFDSFEIENMTYARAATWS